MASLKTDCRKFAPNIFNKSKCQNCFRGKDAHSAEALESNRATRKMCLCGYLFVAPDWDFSLPANRNKRWQRRWFVLFDDGELTYSVDEHPDTIPQAIIDMNCVLEVADAENVTGNQFALAITSPEKVHFIKGTNKEETKKWFEVLSKFPRNTVCGKYKRNATFPCAKSISVPGGENNTSGNSHRRETVQVTQINHSRHTSYLNDLHKDKKNQASHIHYDPEGDVYPTKDTNSQQAKNYQTCKEQEKEKNNANEAKTEKTPQMTTSNNIPNCKDVSPSINVHQFRCKETATSFQNNQNGVSKGNEDVTKTAEKNKKLGRGSIKDLDISSTESIRRYLKHEMRELRKPHSHSDVSKMIPPLIIGKECEKQDWKNIALELDTTDSNNKNYHHNPVYLIMSDVPSGKKFDSYESFFKDEKPQVLRRQRSFGKKNDLMKHVTSWSGEQKENEMRNRTIQKSASVPDATTYSAEHKNIPNGIHNGFSISHKEKSSKYISRCSEKVVHDTVSQVRGDPDGCNLDTIASSCCTSSEYIADQNSENLFLKKGWLVKQDLNKWNKHWFVLRNSALTYYADPIAEDAGILDGVVDLRQVKGVSEVQSNNGHTFCILMKDSTKLFLSAVTAKIRSNWIRAVLQAANIKEITRSESFSRKKHENDLKSQSIQVSKDKLAVTHVRNHSVSSADSESNVTSSQHSRSTSVADEEDQENQLRTHHSSVALPPSPPLARTAISRVKERARTRSNSRSRTSRFRSQEMQDADHNYLADSDGGTTDHSSSSLPATGTTLHSKERILAKETGLRIVEEKVRPERRRSLKLTNTDDLPLFDGRKKITDIKDKLEDSSWTIWLDVSKFCKEVESKLDDIEKRNKDVQQQTNCKDSSSLHYVNADQKKEVSNLLSSLCKVEERLQKVQNELEKAKVNLLMTNRDADLEAVFKKSIGCQSLKEEVTRLNGMSSQNILLAQQLNKVKEENRKLKQDVKIAHKSSDEFELHCITLQQDKKQCDDLYTSQMALMIARVDDLTSKLFASEKNVRQLKQRVMKLEQRQERRRSSLKGKEGLSLSKEYESKLSELEQKIDAVEATLKTSETSATAVKIMESNSFPGKDEQPSSETQSLLMRLHRLDKKVKDVSEIVDRFPEEYEKQEDFTKPKIRLQVKLNESPQNQDPSEDWNSLSLSTSMTDLSKQEEEEEEDEKQLSLSFHDCLENLGQKVNSLVSWLKTALQLLHTQSNSTTIHSAKVNIINEEAGEELGKLVCALEYVTGKIEETQNLPQGLENVVGKLLCNIILLQEITNIVFKMCDFEKYKNIILIQHLNRIKQAISGIEHYISQKSNTTHVNNQKTNLCNIIALLLFYRCSAPLFSNQSACEFSQQVEHLYEEVETSRKRVSSLLYDYKVKFIENFCATIGELSENSTTDPQDPIKGSEQKSDLRLLGQKQFLSHISHIITQVSQSFVAHISKSLNEVYFLWSSVQYSEQWTTYICKLLQQELNLLASEIKNLCIKHLENNFFSSSKCGVLVEYMHCSILELSQIVAINSIVEGTVVLIKDAIYCIEVNEIKGKSCMFVKENKTALKEMDQDALTAFHEHLQHRTMSIMSNLPMHLFPNAFWSLCNSSEINVAHRSVSSLICFKQKWKQKMENERRTHKSQMDQLTQKLNALREEEQRRQEEGCKSCTELRQEVSYLQAELDESHALARSGSLCEKCKNLRLEIQKLVEQHERDSFLIQRLEDQDGRWKKHAQDIVKEKEKLFNEEKWKLEKELHSAQRLLHNVESQYDEEIRSLQSLYEQKLSQKQDSIKEDTLRYRYSSEIDQLKSLCEKGLAAMEASHQRIMNELEQRHQNELDDLMAEREKVLAEEAHATAIALGSVRKAHKEELQRQIEKFKEEFVQKMNVQCETEAFKKGYEVEMSKIKHEILSMTEKYSVKCLENAALQENLEMMTEQLKATNCQVLELLAKNRQLQARLASDTIQKQDELL